ncbi:MAG TPA: cysteine--1-D-myo-inosityl 2-amino-2-deoxy-alpha-D-glucopyranoside ligase [Jiangellaceae bacterium]|nr:cysteine--1-D-myo-inosityl 2-amino-2-deoxy-alpha-D-glucopyranoside ligase [Jiangellaceae bacterium]
MRAWTAPEPPQLPGRGHPIRLYDTAVGQVRPTAPGPQARMYVCGVTPYDATHLGHAATYLAFDLLNRAWHDAGHDVRYVQNVTDIDEPLLERAEQTDLEWNELAAQQIDQFRDDMAWLHVLPPDDFVGAVESVPLIAGLIEQVRNAGATYEVEGDLYFSVEADPRFGSISHLDHEAMVALSRERGGDPDRAGKKDPVDSVLWWRARPGLPSWESPFGPGRPGWHIECAAIALHYLGDAFDVQGGGSDLVFPHHEMSASHVHVTGRWPFARAYVHAGMVGLGGEKMSKSLGNLEFVSRLRTDGRDATAVRMALLSDHYRADRDWTSGLLAAADDRLARWRAAVAAPAGPDASRLLSEVRAFLADDLDTPRAMAAVDRWVEQTRLRAGSDPTAPALVRDLLDALLGISLP